MNPDIIRAARALIKAKQKYPDLTEAEADVIARGHGVELPGVVEYVSKLRADGGNLVASGIQGFTANMGDEIIGDVVPEALGGGESGKEEMRLRQELAKLDHPGWSTAAEVAGGVGSAVVGGAGMARMAARAPVAGLARIGRNIKMGAKTGATYGGAYGVGGGETGEERLREGAAGAVTGAILGGAISAVGSTLSELTPSATVLRKHLAAIDASDGMVALRAKLASFTGRPDVVTPADLSPYLAHNLNEATRRDLSTYVKADKLLSPRDKMLKADKRKWAKAEYDKLRDLKVEFTPEDLSAFVDTPTITETLRLAKLAEDITSGGPLQKLLERVQAGSRSQADMDAIGQIANRSLLKKLGQKVDLPDRPVTLTDLHRLQRALSGKAGKAFKSGDGDLGQAYKMVRRQVLDAIEAKVPEYKAVRAEFATKTQFHKDMKETTDAVVGPIPTDTPHNPAGSVAHSMVYGYKHAAANVVGKLFGHPHAARVAKKMGKDMLTRGTDNVEYFLRRLEEPVSLFRAGRTGALSGVAAPYVNSLFGNRDR